MIASNLITSPLDRRDGGTAGAARRTSQCFPIPNTARGMFTDTSEGKIDGAGVGRLEGVDAENDRYRWPGDK